MPRSNQLPTVDAPLPPAFAEKPQISQELSSLLVSVRRHLHMHPEVGLKEHETSAFIREVLEMHGMIVHGPLAGTGLYTDIEGDLPGPRIGYRADIDALPIQDEKEAPYASTHPNVAHLCGHDVHTSVGIGVALMLHEERHHLAGSVRVFFQPNEEGNPSGAPLMIRDGVLEGLEAVYAIHVDPTLPTGRFGLMEGAITAAADRFRICVSSGQTGHSARPHQTIDTLWVTTQIANALYQLIGRVTDARNASVLTICRFHAGEAYNVIPAEAEFGGTLRSTNQEDRKQIKHHIARTAEQIASMYGAHIEVAVEDGSPPVVNDARLVQVVRETSTALFGVESIFEIPRPSMGSEDFAYYLEHIPGALIRVGTSCSPATSYSLHHAKFDVDEASMSIASHLMSRVLINYLHSSNSAD